MISLIKEKGIKEARVEKWFDTTEKRNLNVVTVLNGGKGYFSPLGDGGTLNWVGIKFLPKRKNRISTDAEILALAKKLEITSLTIEGIEKALQKVTSYRRDKAAAVLNSWAILNSHNLWFTFLSGGGMYSNPRLKGFEAGVNGERMKGIFSSYSSGNAWVGDSSDGIIVEHKVLQLESNSNSKTPSPYERVFVRNAH